jgi:hypothetical protein
MTTLKDSVNIKDIKALTKTIRDERNKNRYMIAAEMAKTEITKDYLQKIQNAASDGSYHTDLYSWEFVKDKREKKYSFNNVRISDILFREPTDNEQNIMGECLKDILEKEFKHLGFGFSIYSWRESPNRKKSIRISWYDQKDNDFIPASYGDKEEGSEKNDEQYVEHQ